MSPFILLDIEGTTTPIAFVTEVLYPYARVHLAQFLDRHAGAPQYRDLVERFGREHAADETRGEQVPPWPASAPDDRPSVIAYAGWLMDRDRKSPALKELQGWIWEAGYLEGELVGEVYPDVGPALARWHAGGRRLGIFSSGSVRAQRWLFRCSSAGDLSPFLGNYFDTSTGAKQDPASYVRIAAKVGEAPAGILFVSDVAGELDAARQAGLDTIMSVRPGNPRQPSHDHRVVSNFDEIAGG